MSLNNNNAFFCARWGRTSEISRGKEDDIRKEKENTDHGWSRFDGTFALTE